MLTFWTKTGHFAVLAPFGGYTFHLRLIGKLAVNFLFVY